MNNISIEKLDFTQKCKLAEDKKTDKDVLVKLSKDENISIKLRVIYNSSTPTYALYDMAETSNDERVLIALAMKNIESEKINKAIEAGIEKEYKYEKKFYVFYIIEVLLLFIALIRFLDLNTGLSDSYKIYIYVFTGIINLGFLHIVRLLYRNWYIRKIGMELFSNIL